MENYKKIIRTRILLLTVPIIIAVGLGIYNVFFASQTMRESFIFGFQCGAATGVGFLAIVYIVKYRIIMKDENKIKLYFIKENDERLRTIREKAGMPMILITSIFMIIAGVIAGYFDPKIFIVLVVAATFQMFIAGIVKIFYINKI